MTTLGTITLFLLYNTKALIDQALGLPNPDSLNLFLSRLKTT